MAIPTIPSTEFTSFNIDCRQLLTILTIFLLLSAFHPKPYTKRPETREDGDDFSRRREIEKLCVNLIKSWFLTIEMKIYFFFSWLGKKTHTLCRKKRRKNHKTTEMLLSTLRSKAAMILSRWVSVSFTPVARSSSEPDELFRRHSEFRGLSSTCRLRSGPCCLKSKSSQDEEVRHFFCSFPFHY